MQYHEVIKKLQSMRNEKNIEGMARFGINPDGNLGISVTTLRKMARDMVRDIGKDGNRRQKLALQLWDSGIRDARLLASMIADPRLTTEELMESWVKDFNSWDLCDSVCGTLFDRTSLAYEKAMEWTEREEEFVKRAGFVLQAWLAVHDKKAGDVAFEDFFPIIKRHAHDERNYVKKAVNWSLRSIGKRNQALNRKAIRLAGELGDMDSKAARWIGKDALRELKSEKVQKKVNTRREKKSE